MNNTNFWNKIFAHVLISRQRHLYVSLYVKWHPDLLTCVGSATLWQSAREIGLQISGLQILCLALSSPVDVLWMTERTEQF